MGTLTKHFSAVLVLGLMSSGCDLGPVGTPPPLTLAQAKAVLACQHVIKVSAAGFMHVKLVKLGGCADKILALQLQLENGLITQAVFDAKIALVRVACLGLFDAIGKSSTALANAIVRTCSPVEALIISAYDPLQFVVVGDTTTFDGFPGFLGPIESLEDIVRYTCITGEVFMDIALFYNIPRLIPLLDIVGLDPFVDIPLDPRCGSVET